MNVAIVDYNAGNIRSVLFALDRLGVEGRLTADASELRAADRVIFPGVGEAGSAMAALHEKGLGDVIAGLTRPVLGVCLGLQLLCEYSEENGTSCLGVFPHQVSRFEGPGKVPHVGWNSVEHNGHALFEGIPSGAYFYFVHGYRADVGSATCATTDYDGAFSAALCSRNFYSVQFHPEKSAEAGKRLLHNFLSLPA